MARHHTHPVAHALHAARSPCGGAVPDDAGDGAPARRARRDRPLRVRSPLLPAVGAAGSLGRPVPGGRAGQPAPHGPHPRRARADPRLQGPAARLEPDRNRRAGLDGVHAAPRPGADAQAALGDPDGAGARAPGAAARASRRPADARDAQGGPLAGGDLLPQGAPAGLPRFGAERRSSPRLPVRHARASGARARRRGDGEAAGRRPVPARRLGRPGRARVHV